MTKYGQILLTIYPICSVKRMFEDRCDTFLLAGRVHEEGADAEGRHRPDRRHRRRRHGKHQGRQRGAQEGHPEPGEVAACHLGEVA